MKVISEPLPGVKVLEPFIHRDFRGEFVKTFHEKQLAELGIQISLKEEFFSISSEGILRGMHFQLPPFAHQKLIYCIEGAVLDVVLDLRIGSPTYGHARGIPLSSENRHLIFIPVGFAHGFLSLRDQSCLIYKTDFTHVPSHDAGILWNSFDFDWPMESPKLSPRDQSFPGLKEFSSPFTFSK